MSSHHLFYALLVVSAVVSLGVAGIAWRNRDIEGTVPLAGLMLAVAVWSVMKLLELVSPSLSATLFWSNMQYVGIVSVPAAWLVFALR